MIPNKENLKPEALEETEEGVDREEQHTASRDEDKVTIQKAAIDVIRELTADEDETIDSHTPITIASIVGGDFFGSKWFRRQFWYIVMIVGMLIVYISSRYSCQQALIENKSLNDTLLDRRYKALTRSSQLKEKTRRSHIEESLTDTTLQTSVTPSFNLSIEKR